MVSIAEATYASLTKSFGGNGYMTEYGIERIVRDALGSTVYSGTSDIQKNIISRLLGL